MHSFGTLAAQSQKTSLALVDLASSTAEVVGASLFVIGERSALMATALCMPWAADRDELELMVPEKVTAFTRAGAILVDGWWEAQKTTGRYVMESAFAASPYGCRRTSGDIMSPAERAARWAAMSVDDAVATLQRALVPVHGSATANARRLRSARAGT